MDLNQRVRRLLKEIYGPSIVSASPYDTAWIARLGGLNPDMSKQAVEWLRANQLADGSWGTPIPYHHDRAICTLSALIALSKFGSVSSDRLRCQRGELALENSLRALTSDPAGATVGFEMIVPTLLIEAHDDGLISNRSFVNGQLKTLNKYREAKLNALPHGMINRHVTVAFSVEMVGTDGLHLIDVDNLQEDNGSVAYSPAATAFYARHVQAGDAAAFKYLQSVTSSEGAVPYVGPIEVFERSWPLWNLGLLENPDPEWLELCQPHLDFLVEEWEPGKGVAACSGLSLLDGDDTALTFDALGRFGRSVDLDGVLHYEEADHFRCYGLEANPSISTNIHVLGALRQADLPSDHPAVTKVLQFLFRSQTLQLFWFDKWHASPYYPTTHMIIACAGYVDWLVDDAVYWLLETQNRDGSWGYYLPTAEETAYCLQALAIWRQEGHDVPPDILKRGAEWLKGHVDPPYPPLWIGKCLYCPELVVQSSVLSALLLLE